MQNVLLNYCYSILTLKEKKSKQTQEAHKYLFFFFSNDLNFKVLFSLEMISCTCYQELIKQNRPSITSKEQVGNNTEMPFYFFTLLLISIHNHNYHT